MRLSKFLVAVCLLVLGIIADKKDDTSIWSKPDNKHD
jgi:hypothetical protein